MRRLLWSVLPLVAAAIFLVPHTASAQVGSVAGVVRDASDAVLPGVTVEVTSPALIEKVRSTVTDNSTGRYQITNLPVGTYTVTFTLTGFSVVRQTNVIVTSDFTAQVNAKMTVGGLNQTVEVKAEAPIVNVTTPGVQQVLQGAEIGDLPTQRDIPSLLNLVPGFQTSSLRGACNGGVGLFCNPTVPLFNAHTSPNDTDGQNQGRIMVDGMSINMGRAGTGINENVGQANGIVLNTAAAQEVAFTLSGSLGESETGGAAINIVPRTGGNRFTGGYALTYTNISFFDRNTGSRLRWSPTAGNLDPSNTENSFVYDYDMTGTFGGPIKKDRLWFYLQGRKQDQQKFPGGQDPGALNKNAYKFAANWDPIRDCHVTTPLDAERDCHGGGLGRLTYTNEYKNASARLTFQASQKNKFNVYWDEQDACTNPCYGMISTLNSLESYFTLMSRPNRLMQLSWTNPFTNRLLFDAGISVVPTHQDQTKAREFVNPRSLPRVCENGSTVGRDEFSSRLNSFVGVYNGGAGTCNVFSSINSGSLNDAFPGNTNAYINDDTYRTRASASYITGTHNIKLGWDGAYFSEKLRNEANDLRISYHYGTPQTGGAWNATNRTITAINATIPANCVGAPRPGCALNPAFPGDGCFGAVRNDASDIYACGNMTLYYPDDPTNKGFLRPAPVGVDVNSGIVQADEKVWFGALYLQDQWTYNRFTLNGALRYDHAQSRYGATCVGPDLFVPTAPVLAADNVTVLVPAQPSGQWCSTAQDGVKYDDITPRGGVAWDVFGTGKTSVKVNVGKYLQSAGFGGLYTGFNDAKRSVNQLTRAWQDLNGNRIFECDMSQWQQYYTNDANRNAGDFCGGMTAQGGGPSTDFQRFGRAPTASQLAVSTASCGLPNSTEVQKAYCSADGVDQNLMSGWGKRRYEWQFGLGVQHEVLPRMSLEVTYNRRKYGNLTDTDTVAQGCDYTKPPTIKVNGVDQPEWVDPGNPLNPILDASTCTNAWANYTDPTGIRDFYSVTAPSDPRLPGGGGYVIKGLTNQARQGSLPSGAGGVAVIRDDLGYSWAGIDTNVVMRARGGLRLSGGTSTGRSNRNTCATNIDAPNVKGRVGNELGGGCRIQGKFLTNVRGNASYTIPWIDVLASAVIQYRPGPNRTANWTYYFGQANWEADSAARAGLPFNGGGFTPVLNTQTVDLLDFNELYGEGMRLVDMTFRKNLRFAGKRLSLGLDIYNIFNSDAALGYVNTYNAYLQGDGTLSGDDPNTGGIEFQDWGRVNSITNPRFARYSLTFDF
jgi:hypothetical protein